MRRTIGTDVLELPEVHVHGLPLNKDQQLGPVAESTPWPGIPSSLDGKELDDWMKARMMVSKDAKVTVVVLEPCKHRELTIAGMARLEQMDLRASAERRRAGRWGTHRAYSFPLSINARRLPGLSSVCEHSAASRTGIYSVSIIAGQELRVTAAGAWKGYAAVWYTDQCIGRLAVAERNAARRFADNAH